MSKGSVPVQSADATHKMPNVLITGTPGVGKSTLCSELKKYLNYMTFLDISSIAKERNWTSGYDNHLNSFILDEDKMVFDLEKMLKFGGHVVEYHSSECFPSRWFDLVFVVCANNTILYDRLQSRGYSQVKIKKNVECEIFMFSYEEAMNTFNEHIVFKFDSENRADLEKNIAFVLNKIQEWYLVRGQPLP